MKVPLGWLDEYTDIKVSPLEFARGMTLSGTKVEAVETHGAEITGVVIGKVLSIGKHPNADRLLVSSIDTGAAAGVIQVITGARNVNRGDYIPVAVDGALLPGSKSIVKSTMRGVESCGMMCSLHELNLSKEDYPDADEDGIFILKESFCEKLEPGMEIFKALGLDETVVEFEITPNRPDCLCMLGIAREASATFDTELRKPEIIVKEQAGCDAGTFATVEILDAGLCPRYAARIIRDVKTGPSPLWMQKRLKAAGMRPVNNIVDVTNYVMLELGQPMHAFDLDKLGGSRIIVRRAYDGEVMKTLDGQGRMLDSSMLVIADESVPVAVAGVMGGADSEVTPGTRNILLESANFHGISVRFAAKKLGIRTEASARFEKGLDINNVIAGINRAAQLIEGMNAGKVCAGIIDCCPAEILQKQLKLRPDKINSLLGTQIDTARMVDILENLELGVDTHKMLVSIPGFRGDIERDADLAEEIARFYGYNSIKPSLLEGKASTAGRRTYRQKIRDLIRDTMLSCGFFEIYTYSFMSPGVFDRLCLPEDSPLRNTITISNPLGEDYSVMRTTTIPGMLEAISRNYSRDIDRVRLFDISFVYIPGKLPLEALPVEKQILTLGMYGEADFYDIKGAVDELLAHSGIQTRNIRYIAESNNPAYHPGRTAKIVINDEDAGVIGEVHPEVAENFEIPERTYIAVLDMDILIKNADRTHLYKALPRFPAVMRDMAIVVKDDITTGQLEDVIRHNAGDALEELTLFDVYRGAQVPEGMKSMAYSLVFRLEDRTMRDEEVNMLMDKILGALETGYSAKLRV